jgi:hypothetical protein
MEQPAWVTVTVTRLQPEDENVSVATRGLQIVLAVKLAVTVAFPLPDAGERVHHAWLLETVHAQVVVNAKVVDPAADVTFRLVGDTDNEQAAWVTEIVLGLPVAPVAVMVMVPERAAHVELAVKLTVIVAFPVPLAGLTDNHDISSVIVQPGVQPLNVRVKDVEPDVLGKLNEDAEVVIEQVGGIVT